MRDRLEFGEAMNNFKIWICQRRDAWGVDKVRFGGHKICSSDALNIQANSLRKEYDFSAFLLEIKADGWVDSYSMAEVIKKRVKDFPLSLGSIYKRYTGLYRLCFNDTNRAHRSRNR